LWTKHYNKRDDLYFPVVNYPFMCDNILIASAYGVYISQLMRFSTACISVCPHLNTELLLTRVLMWKVLQSSSWLDKPLGNICVRDDYEHIPFIDGKLRPFLSLVHDLLLNIAYHQTCGMSFLTSSLVEHLSFFSSVL
jgi:hypothetical protein